MSYIVENCPRCKAKKITFEILHSSKIRDEGYYKLYEVFSNCRNCGKNTVFTIRVSSEHEELNNKKLIVGSSINSFVTVLGYISLKDEIAISPPQHIPENIHNAFTEGASCFAIGCHNASASMFRLCLDLATKSKIAELPEGSVDQKVRKYLLKNRLDWLFENGHLPHSARELAECIKDNGNDGAHDGTLAKEDAEDLLEFTTLLLEKFYTEPKKVELAMERRKSRRAEQLGEA